MPNGGSDCCMTCWFNRKNRGERDWQKHRSDREPDYCTIRAVTIDSAAWTYCANHPLRRPDRDPVPIGPITRNLMKGDNDREAWIQSPDTEEIRLHLLWLLDGLFEHTARGWYPIGDSLAEVIIWQLGQFRERRAFRTLQWITENLPGPLENAARNSLNLIRAGD
ncbi:MAG: hypothetical protein OXH52_13285 [Gammaproteobacteria bacterium]|nr:hypothetical protein [Gammaproteobacteria bacterium]